MLKLNDIRRKLSFKIHETSMVHGVSDFERYGYTIDYDVFLKSKGKNLQREFCWTIEQKAELIISMLKGIKIANISVIQQSFEHKGRQRDTVLQIIDGKQRLSTIIGYTKNEFPIIFKGSEYFYTDLEEDAQYEINHRLPLVNLVYEWFYEDGKDNVIISDNEKIAWFEMINFAGTPQDIEHLNNLKK
jgi:hypothetical protein